MKHRTPLHDQLEANCHYLQMQRWGEEDPSYRTSYLCDVGSEDAPLYTIVVDIFEDDAGIRVVPFMDMVGPDGEFHHFELDPDADLQTLEQTFLSIYRALYLGSTLHPS
jgi:hypothetical protein